MSEKRLFYAIAAGVFVGGVYGWFAGESAAAVGWIGDLFLDALKMLVIPLIFASMIEAVTGMVGRANLGSVAAKTFAYYVMTTLIAVIIGMVVVSLMRPGVGVQLGAAPGPAATVETGLAAIASSIINPNLFDAAAKFQILPLLVFALLFGMGLVAAGKPAEPAIAFFVATNAAMMRIVGWVMLAAPVGVAALVAAHLGKAGGGAGFARELAAIGFYFATVLVGLGLHAFLVLPLILVLLAGRSPRVYASNLGEALLTAFSTASSSATLPLTMRLSTERNRVSQETAGFVLPMGATVNMDGTALYEAVAAVFIAQASGVELGFGSQLVIVLTATLASVGAAGIPQAGLVTMVIVLQAVGLPLEGIASILAVDWLLDRFRTTVNVWGDAIGAAVVDRTSSATLHPND